MSAATLLACSHGTSSSAGQAAVAALVEAVAAQHLGTVRAAFVDVEPPDIPTALTQIDGPVRVVPLLLSAGYHVYVDVAAAVAQRPETTVSGALGPDHRLVRVLLRRLYQAGLRPGDQVVLAAAGSSDQRAIADCRAMARMLGQALGQDIVVGFLSAAQPRLVELLSDADSEVRTVVASYLLAPGYFFDQVEGSDADAIAAPLLLPSKPVPPELVSIVAERFAGHGPTREFGQALQK
ncbi:MAG: sirohydrochlorin chelatase [Beutenbergiaceae bacterium]